MVQNLSDIGAILDNNGNSKEAISYFQRALQVNPSYCEARYNLAIAYYHRGDLQNSLQEAFRCECGSEGVVIAQRVILKDYLNRWASSLPTIDPLTIKIRRVANDSLKLEALRIGLWEGKKATPINLLNQLQ